MTDILPELGYAGSKEPVLEMPPSWETQRPCSPSNQAQGSLGWDGWVKPQLRGSQRKPPAGLCPRVLKTEAESHLRRRGVSGGRVKKRKAKVNVWRQKAKSNKIWAQLEPKVAHRRACRGFAGQDLKSEPTLGCSVGSQSTDPSVRKLLQNGGADSLHPPPEML